MTARSRRPGAAARRPVTAPSISKSTSTPMPSRIFAHWCSASMSGIEMKPGRTSMIAWPRLSATNGSPAMLKRNATSRAKNIARAPTSSPVRARRSNRLMYGTIRRVVFVASPTDIP